MTLGHEMDPTQDRNAPLWNKRGRALPHSAEQPDRYPVLVVEGPRADRDIPGPRRSEGRRFGGFAEVNAVFDRVFGV